MRTGKTDKAIRDFRMIIEINPKHMDAMRHIRLYDMRRRASGDKGAQPSGEGGGLFGKFFKR
jgi:hypothetical protein